MATATAAAFWIFVAIVVYFLPLLIALFHGRRNRTAIGLLNLLLGWTVVGWIVALMWAVTKEEPTTAGDH